MRARGVEREIDAPRGIDMHGRCAALPLHLLIYSWCPWHRRHHSPADTSTVHPHHVVHSLTARARTHAHAHTHAHTHAQDEHTHTPHALPLCRWHCCHHPQIYLHPHRHRTRTHAHGTRTHTRCHSASLPLHLYLRRWHRCRHPQIAALEDDSPHVPKAVYSPEVPVAAYT